MVRDTIPFLFLGGSPALDFVNTEIVSRGEPADLLENEADLRRWIAAGGLGSAGSKKSGLSEAKALRAELRRIFLKLSEGGSLRQGDLDGINTALSRVSSRSELRLRDGRLGLETRMRGTASPAFLIARSAAEFLAAADLSLVRQCEGTGCILLFYDTTKSHTRRWCSMAGCGNRAKAAGHYRRVSKSRKAG
jgi:predicted RNA-binding Zn ribbon-like protein